MKKINWIFKTESRQSKYKIAFILIFSFSLGVILSVGVNSYERIKNFNHVLDWNADIIVLPKGMTMDSFESDIRNNKSTSFLPEAIYKSTLEIMNNALLFNAVLITPKGLMVKNKDIGLNWLDSKTKILDWDNQNIYQNQEWGNKLISGFFVKGNWEQVNYLKNIIEKKTIAQAFIVQDENIKKMTMQNKLKMDLIILGSVFIFLTMMGLIGFLKWTLDFLKQTTTYLKSLGYTKNDFYKLFVYFYGLYIVMPFLCGLYLGVQIFVQLSLF